MKRKIIAYVVSAVMVLTMIPATAFAATDTDTSGMSKTAVHSLTAQKAEAQGQIEDLAPAWNYDSANGAKAQALVDEYIGKIMADDVDSLAKINSLVSEARTAINKIETAATTIATYWRSGNATQLDGLYDSAADYSEDNWAKVKIGGTVRTKAAEALAKAQADEDAATVNEIITKFKADIDAVPTVAESAAGDLDKDKADKIDALNDILAEKAYPGATYANDAYTTLLNSYIGTINAATAANIDTVYNAAVTGLEKFIKENQTEAQATLVNAISSNVATLYARYSALVGSSDYTTYNSLIVDKVAKIASPGTEGSYFADFADYMTIAGYNAAARTAIENGDAIATVADVNEVVDRINYEFSLIPTEANKQDAYDEWAEAVWDMRNKADWTSADYEILRDMVEQFRVYKKDSSAAASIGMSDGTASGNYKGLNTWFGNENYAGWNQEFVNRLEDFNKAQQTQVDKLIADLPAAADITAANYLTVATQIADIDALVDDQFVAADDITSTGISFTEVRASESKYTDAVAEVDSIRKAGTDFITAVKAIAVTAEDLQKDDFEWDFADGAEANSALAVVALNDDYKAITTQMLSDSKIVGLADAVELYETLADSVAAAKADIDPIVASIGRLPLAVTLADKATIDSIWEAYNALPEGSQNALASSNASTALGYTVDRGDLETKTEQLVSALDTSAKEALDAAKIKSTADWSKLTADMITLYNTIKDADELYGDNVTVSGTNIDLLGNVIAAYDVNAADAIEADIIGIPRNPADATDADLAAVEEARADYDALLTDAAKENFKRSGYLAWLEEYESYLNKYNMAQATIDTVEDQVTRGTDPTVVVTDASGATLTEDTDYSVRYVDDNHAGLATVIATGKGAYDGEVSCTFVVVNNAKKILSLKSNSKKTFTVKYNDYSKHNCTGTQIQWSSKKGTWYDKYTKNTSNKASKKISVAKSGKKYVRVRPIVNIDGVRYYGPWSTVKTVNVK